MNENMTLPGRVSGLHAVRNIRELGGAEARDGRHVRCGLLYRGSTLEGLEQEERAAIDGLGLRCVLDLRAASEAAEHPEYVPEGASYQRVAGMYEPSGAEMDFSPDAIARMQSVGGADDIMRTLYLTMVRGNPALHALVEHLAAGDVPLYFHCSAGKDRTGIAAALILAILGVSDEAVVKNFLLTNRYRAELIDNPPNPLPPYLSSVEMWRRANSVHEADLRAVLAAMGTEGPKREAFLQSEYGLGPKEVATLRDRYLE